MMKKQNEISKLPEMQDRMDIRILLLARVDSDTRTVKINFISNLNYYVVLF